MFNSFIWSATDEIIRLQAALQKINSSFEQLLSFIPPKFYLPQNYPHLRGSEADGSQAAGKKRGATGLDLDLDGFGEDEEGIEGQAPQKKTRKETAADKKAEKKRLQREARMAKVRFISRSGDLVPEADTCDLPCLLLCSSIPQTTSR